MKLRVVSPSGFLVAALGFFLTRFTVTLAAYTDPTQFLFAGIVPLVLGLLLSAFGVVLAVGAFEPRYVRLVALWTVAGTVAMLFLVVLTVLGSDFSGGMGMDVVRTQTYFSNFLIGGSAGGAITGMYAARNRRQREDLTSHANRLTMLNRILREEVLNAVTVIKGHVDLLETGDSERSTTVIDEQNERIENTVNDVRYLTQTGWSSDPSLAQVSVGDALADALDGVRTLHPDATFRVEDSPVDDTVMASPHLTDVFYHLLDNAARHADSPAPTVEVEFDRTAGGLTVRVRDEGPGIPEDQRAILESGEIAEYDDPTTGFGLNIVRLLVESFDGAVRTEVTDDGSTVAVTLPTGIGAASTPAEDAGLSTYGIPGSRLVLAIVVGIVAGAVMGVLMQATAGVVPVIGGLYGVMHPLVGWLTHEFHSVVFALVYAVVLRVLPSAYAESNLRRVLVGVAWALVLYAVAAGLVMPVWLRIVGFPATVPNLPLSTLFGHLVWGLAVGVLYTWGDRVLEAERR